MEDLSSNRIFGCYRVKSKLEDSADNPLVNSVKTQLPTEMSAVKMNLSSKRRWSEVESSNTSNQIIHNWSTNYIVALWRLQTRQQTDILIYMLGKYNKWKK